MDNSDITETREHDVVDRMPTATFDSSMVAPADRLTEFARLTPGYDKLLPTGENLDAFNMVSHAWLLDDLVITANTASPIEFRRTPAHIKAYARDTYTLILLVEGAWWTEIDGHRLDVAVGDVVIMDFTVPWHVHGATQHNIMMVLPRPLLDAAVPDAPRLHGRVLQGASGWLFAEHLKAVVNHLPNLPQRDAALVRSATLCLFNNAVAALSNEAPLPSPAASRALPLERIRSFVDAHLGDGDLDAARICRDLAVTRSTLYRAFHPIGGVANYIQQRRLLAARDCIVTGDARTSIAEIADRFHFSSPAHFSTMFRRQFGLTPSDAREAAASPANPDTLFESWLEVLDKTVKMMA